jgi:hypothetical protein
MTEDIAIAISAELDLLKAIGDIPYKDEPRDRLAHDSAIYLLHLGLSSSLLLTEEHTVAFQILLRSISEAMIKLGWGLQCDENAISLEMSAHNDFRRNLNSLIKDGVLSLERPDGSALDETVLALAIVDKEHRSTNVREMARALGLDHFYQLLYKNLSMQTHGTASIVSPTQPKTEMVDRANALLGGLQTVKILSAKWLTLRERVEPSSLQSMLLQV